MSTAAPLSFAPSTAHVAYDYAVLDVFAEQPLEGNALAVFTDARGLSTEEMQAIARETNLNETTFILPRDETIEREDQRLRANDITYDLIRFNGGHRLDSETLVKLAESRVS